MAYTLLDVAYAMYYPEAEFGIGDTLGRLKSGVRERTKGVRKAWKSGRTSARAKMFRKAGGDQYRQLNSDGRGFMRSKAFRDRLREVSGKKLGSRR